MYVYRYFIFVFYWCCFLIIKVMVNNYYYIYKKENVLKCSWMWKYVYIKIL